jgi:hypothetical protein
VFCNNCRNTNWNRNILGMLAVAPSKTLCCDKRKAGPVLESIDKKNGVTKRFNNVKGFLLVCIGCSVKFRMKLKSRL